MESFKARIRRLRKEADCSQAELAAALKKSQAYISLIEIGSIILTENDAIQIVSTISKLGKVKRAVREAQKKVTEDILAQMISVE